MVNSLCNDLITETVLANVSVTVINYVFSMTETTEKIQIPYFGIVCF